MKRSFSRFVWVVGFVLGLFVDFFSWLRVTASDYVSSRLGSGIELQVLSLLRGCVESGRSSRMGGFAFTMEKGFMHG